MKNECPIVQDLLPLYAEKMVSAETAAFVEEHLKDCRTCRREYELFQEPKPVQEPREAAPLQKLSRKLRAKRIQAIALTTAFVAALFVSAFAVLDAPDFQPYSEELVTVEALGEKELTLTFAEGVTGFRCEKHGDPDDSGVIVCDIEAWTTLWDSRFSKETGRLSTTVEVGDGPMELFYVPNDGSENIRLARFDPYAKNRLEIDGRTKGDTTMPRLALGYYLLFMLAALIVTAVAWGFTRKNRTGRIWTERIGLYPVAYIIAHVIVCGVGWTTWTLSRDLALILFLSLLLYGALLLLHNILQSKATDR